MLRTTMRRFTARSALMPVVVVALTLVASADASVTKKPATNGNPTGELGEAPSLSCASQPIGRGYTVSGLVITRSPKNHSDYSYTCHALIASIVDRNILATHELKQPSASL